MGRTVLWIMGLGFLAFGVAYLVDPHGMMSMVGVELDSASGAADVRAIYGGLEIGVGLFLLACARQDSWIPPGLLASAYAFSLVGGARLVGIVRDQATDGMTFAALAIEVVCAGISAFAYRSQSSLVRS